MFNGLHTIKWSNWIMLANTVKLFEIDWTVIEKLQPEHDPKWTCSWDLLPTGRRRWRHFRLKCKDHSGRVAVNFEVAGSSSFRILWIILWTVKSVTAEVAWTWYAATTFERLDFCWQLAHYKYYLLTWLICPLPPPHWWTWCQSDLDTLINNTLWVANTVNCKKKKIKTIRMTNYQL